MTTWAQVYRCIVHRLIAMQKTHLSSTNTDTPQHHGAVKTSQPSAPSTQLFVSFRFQYIAAFVANISLFAAGIASGWNSPTIPRLTAPNSPLALSSATAAWLIQTPLVGEVLTSLPCAWLSDRLGPKHTLLLAVLPFTGGAALLAGAAGLAPLFAGRLLVGCAHGIVFTVLPVYLGEIASDRRRGLMIAMQVVLFKSGILCTYAVAPFVSVPTMAQLSAVPALVFVLLFAWCPDSPYHLLERGERRAAREALQWLRGTPAIERELDAIEQSVRANRGPRCASGASGGASVATVRRQCGELFGRANRRCLLVLFGTAAIVPLSGSEVIVEYAQRIFEAMPQAQAATGLNAVETSIVLAAVQLVSAVVGVCTVDWLGRRPLLIWSSVCAALCTAMVCAYFVHAAGSADPRPQFAALAVVALMLFQFAYNAGIDTVTYTLVGELFEGRLKAQLSALYLVVAAGLSMAVGKLFQVVADRWGSEWPFAVFSLCSLAFVVFAVRLIPETRGRSLADIGREMRGAESAASVGGV